MRKKKRYEYATIDAPPTEEREGSDKAAETEGTFLPPLLAASEEIKWKVTPPATTSIEEFALPPVWEAIYKPEWDEEVDYNDDTFGIDSVHPPTT